MLVYLTDGFSFFETAHGVSIICIIWFISDLHQVIFLVKYNVFDSAADIAYATISKASFSLGDRYARTALSWPIYLTLLI